MNSTARGPTITLTNTSQYLQQQPAATQNNIKLEELHAQCEQSLAQSNTFEPVQQNSQNHNHEMANISRLTTNAGHQNQANQMNTHLNTQTTNSTGPKPRGRRKKIRTEPIRPICPQCEKQFSNQSALTKHKLTHSDERKFACQQCSKAFKRHDHLTGHMQTHSNRKPFNCTIQGCDKTYCDARSLRRHKENIHHIVTPKEDHHHHQQQQHCTNNNLNNGLSNNTLHQQPVKLADQHTNTNQLHYLDQSQMNGTTTGLHQAVEQQQHHHQQLDENNNNNNTINNNSSCSSTSSSTNNANSNNNNNNHIDSSSSHIHHLNHQQATANHYNALNNNNLQNTHQVAQVQQHQPGTHVISSTSTLNDLDNSNAANCHAQLQSLQPLEDQSRWTNINHPPTPQIAPGNNTFQQPHQHQQHHHSHHHQQQQQQQIHHHPQASYSADYASTQHFSFDFTHPLEQLDQSNTISHSADSVPIPHSADSVRYGAHSVMANNSSQVHQHQPTQATYISAPTQQPSHLLRRRIQRFHSDRGSYGAGEEPRSEHAGRLDLIQRPMDPLQEQQQVSYSADYASTQHFFELNHTISTTTTSHQPHSADSITDSGLGLNVQYERQMTPTYTSSNNTHQYHLQQASFSADYASTQHFSFDFPNDNQYYN